MTDHLAGIPQLPIATLHTLHQKIIPGHVRTRQRHTARSTGFFSAVLEADAEGDEGLAHVTDVLARHLERFGSRRELVVEWTRP